MGNVKNRKIQKLFLWRTWGDLKFRDAATSGTNYRNVSAQEVPIFRKFPWELCSSGPSQRFRKGVRGRGLVTDRALNAAKIAPELCPPSPKGGIGKRSRKDAWISGTGRMSSRQPPLSANPFSKPLTKAGDCWGRHEAFQEEESSHHQHSAKIDRASMILASEIG